MKLLHISNNLDLGGAEALIHHLVILQKENGIDVSILLMSDSDTFISKDIREKGVPVYVLSSVGKSVRNPFNIFKIIPYLRKYDVVHVHVFPAQYWAAFASVIALSKTPMITTEHSTTSGRRSYAILRAMDKFVYRYVYKTVVACADAALVSLNQYCPKSNNLSIPNGIDVQMFHNAESYTKKERFNLTENDFIVTMVARFQPPKRQILLIGALKYLPTNVHVIFCGQGEELDACKNFAKKIGITDRVHFLGICNDVDRILKTSDVVVLLSRFEGLSLSSIEGMSSGKPFVASRVNGLESIVKDAGILVDNDSQSIASAINKLIKDKVYYEEVANKCWKRAQQYDIYTTEKKYSDLYKEMITASRKK